MVKIENWARSALGNPIALCASEPLPQLKSKNPILLMGGVHGDEPEGVWLAEATLTFLRDKKDTAPWLLVPCLNVDGFKNGTRVNGRGVDLNRNYPAKSWTTAHEQPRYNPGPHAASEPEIQAVVELIENFRPRLVVHCHSWHPCIVCAGEPGMKDGERLARASGYELKPEIGYPTPGSLSEYGWLDHHIPIICIEEQEGAAQQTVWPRFASGMQEIFLDAGMRTR